MNNCASPIPTFPIFATSVDVYYSPWTNTIMMTPNKIVSDAADSITIKYYNCYNNFFVRIINYYVIFIWNPGIILL